MIPIFPVLWMMFSMIQRSSTSRRFHYRLFTTTTSSSSSSSNANPIRNIITSSKSNTLQKVQKLLQQRKKRLEYNQVVVEGPRSVLDVLNTYPHVVRQVIVDCDQPQYHTALLAQFSNNNDISFPEIHYATAKALQSCSDTNQGIVAICDIPTSVVVAIDSQQQQQQQKQCVTLILDGLQDPGNVGTLIRSAAATGVVEHVYFLPGTCDPWNPKALRAAMGTTFGISMKFLDSWDACVKELQQQQQQQRQEEDGIPIYAAAMTDDSVCYHELIGQWGTSSARKNRNKMALIIGSEGNGLSQEIQQALKKGDIQAMHIPMEPVVESLNAAVCGSILLYEILQTVTMRNKE